MTSWSRRLEAADRRPNVAAQRPGSGDVLAGALAAGVTDDDIAVLRALVAVARDRAGFRKRVSVSLTAGGERDFEVAHAERGPVVRDLGDSTAVVAPDADGDGGDGIIQWLTNTLVETPDLVGLFASVGHEALWANDAFATVIPVRAEDRVWLVELLDEWSKGHYEVKVLPALVKYGRWRGRLTLLTGEGQRSVSAVIVAHRDREGEIEAVSMVARDDGPGSGEGEGELTDARFAALVESAAEIIVVCSPEGVVQYASPAALRLAGIDESAVEEPFDVLALVHPDDRPTSLLELAHPDEHGVGVPVDLRLLMPDGGVRHLEVIVSDLTDNPAIHGVVLNARDISQRVQATQALADRAYTDPLTGLPNRMRLLDRLEGLAQDEPELPVAVLLLDLDLFAAVTERLGSDGGDDVVRTIAARIAAAFPAPALVARHSGDQFVVVLPGVGDAAAAIHQGNVARQAVALPVKVGDEVVEVTGSVGVVVATGAGAEGLLQDATRAVAYAKNAGRDRVELFRDEMAEAVGRRQAMEHHLRHALDHDQVVLHYQPIVDVASGSVVAVEALLRVHDGGGQVLSPAELIEAAESSGLIARLGAQVLQVTAEQLASWTDRAGMPDQISVNLSPRQLSDRNLPARVQDALASAGVSPSRLWLELSESILISPQPTVDAAISYLRALGVKVGLDDFGAGKSSLGYLKRFPLDFVKIDRTLIGGLGVDEQDTAIVRATIELAHNLGLTVVAVGVETEEQLEILDLLGCERAQGFLFSPPVPADALADAVRR